MLSTRFAGLLESPSFVFFTCSFRSSSQSHVFTFVSPSQRHHIVAGCYANCMTNQLLRRLPPQPNAAHAIAHSQACKSTGLHSRTHIFIIFPGLSTMKYQWFHLLTLLSTIPYHSSVSREEGESYVMLQDASSP